METHCYAVIDDDERMNFNVAYVLRLQRHVARKNNSKVTW